MFKRKYEIGDGCSTLSGKRMLSPLDKVQIVNKSDIRYDCILKKVESSSEIRREIAAGLGLTLNINNISIDANSKFNIDIKFNQYSLFYVLRINCIEKSELLVRNNSLKTNDKIIKLFKENPVLFYSRYGDALISQIDYGRGLVAVIQVNTSLINKKVNSKNSFSLKIPGVPVNNEIFNKISFDSLKKQNVSSIEIHTVGLSLPPKLDVDNINELIGLLSGFKKLCEGAEAVQLSYNTYSYKLLDSMPSKNILDYCHDIDKARHWLEKASTCWDLANSFKEDLNFTYSKFPREKNKSLSDYENQILRNKHEIENGLSDIKK
jgi:hypothetical protein